MRCQSRPRPILNLYRTLRLVGSPQTIADAGLREEVPRAFGIGLVGTKIERRSWGAVFDTMAPGSSLVMSRRLAMRRFKRSDSSLDGVGPVYDLIRHDLAHARDLGHDIIQTLDVLDVDGGGDLDELQATVSASRQSADLTSIHRASGARAATGAFTAPRSHRGRC